MLKESEVPTGIYMAKEDSMLYEYKVVLEKIKKELTKFGLSQNQAKVFTYLGKYGPQSAPEISKSLGIVRTEAYAILYSLQGRGIVTAKFSSPTKYMALPFEEAISTLINAEKEKINRLTEQEKDLAELWKNMPASAIETNDVKTERLQMMEGSSQIYSKMKNMINNAKDQIILLGSERDIARFYHADITTMISNSLTNVRVILSPATTVPDFLYGFDKKKIRLMPTEKSNTRCFIIKDNDEVILFLRNATHRSDDVFAIWSDSKSLIDSIHKLFDYSWESSKDITGGINPKVTLSNNRKQPSSEEMVKVIESIGIKREIVEQSFPTVEDVSELYDIIKKKMHAKNEQEMIRRLREYVEKMNHELLKSIGKINKNKNSK
jgi:sugar-specific transcriptional regulator TrmB